MKNSTVSHKHFAWKKNLLKSDALTTDAPTDTHSFYSSSLREEIEYLREENRAKALIITEIKTLVNPTNMLVTYNENPTDKTTQNRLDHPK